MEKKKSSRREKNQLQSLEKMSQSRKKVENILQITFFFGNSSDLYHHIILYAALFSNGSCRNLLS